MMTETLQPHRRAPAPFIIATDCDREGQLIGQVDAPSAPVIGARAGPSSSRPSQSRAPGQKRPRQRGRKPPPQSLLLPRCETQPLKTPKE